MFGKHRLFILADKKEKLKKELTGLLNKIESIDEEAKAYIGKGTWGQDLFINCLVNNLHFEQEKEKNDNS